MARSSKATALATPRRRRTPEEARAEIIEVARAFLMENRFSELTIERLMAKTKIGRSAFYVYFRDVYELFEIFVHEVSHEIGEAVSEWIKHPGDHREAVQVGLRRALDYWKENGRLIRALEEASYRDERLREIWRREFMQGPIRLVTLAIERYQLLGLIGPLDAHEISIALNSFNLSYLNACLGGPKQKSAEKVLATLEHVWFSTLYGRTEPVPPPAKEARTARQAKKRVTA